MLSFTLFVFVVSSSPAASQSVRPEATAMTTVTVDAKYPWVDSGLVVHKGDRLAFVATGTIRWGAKPDQVAGPDGRDAKPGKIGVGGLIGRVGYSGKPFPVGSTRTPIIMPKDGKLFLGINDFVFKDNAGFFTVTIAEPRPLQEPNPRFAQDSVEGKGADSDGRSPWNLIRSRASPRTSSSPVRRRTPRDPGGTGTVLPSRTTLVPCTLPSSCRR